MRPLLSLALLLPAIASASGVIKATASTEHFSRTQQTVTAMTPDGPPDDKGWIAKTTAELQADVDRLEKALPRLRNRLLGAKALVPLQSQGAQLEGLDLTGERAIVVQVAFKERPEAQEVDDLRRALAEELGVAPPLERDPGRRFRGWVGVIAILAVAAMVALALRYGRPRRAPKAG